MNNANKQHDNAPRNSSRTGLDFAAEDSFWRDNHRNASYASKDDDYEDYAPAYRTGYEGRERHAGKRFEEVEGDLRSRYESGRGNSSLTWEKAKGAARAAWDRVERAMPGDADGDGK
jgi:hypothetical protein